MAETAIGPRFSIGNVLARSFDLLFRNLAAIFGLIAIVLIPALVLGGLLFFLIVGSVSALGSNQGLAIVGGLLIGLFFMVVYQLMTVAIIHALFQSLRGQPVRLGASISLGFSRLGALILVTIIFALALLAGFIALIVPGLIVMMVWYVAVPACVIERRDAVDSLARSQDLTRGHRWEIFGLMVIIMLGSGLGSFLIEALFGLVLGEGMARAGGTVWSLLTTGYSAVAVTVVYHDLRAEKEGVDADQIAQMFA